MLLFWCLMVSCERVHATDSLSLQICVLTVRTAGTPLNSSRLCVCAVLLVCVVCLQGTAAWMAAGVESPGRAAGVRGAGAQWQMVVAGQWGAQGALMVAGAPAVGMVGVVGVAAWMAAGGVGRVAGAVGRVVRVAAGAGQALCDCPQGCRRGSAVIFSARRV